MDGPHALERGEVGRVPGGDEVEQLVVRAHEVHVAHEEALLVLDAAVDELRDLVGVGVGVRARVRVS